MPVDFLKDLNITQLLAMVIMLWFFYSRVDLKITKLDEKLSNKIDKIESRLTFLENDMIEVKTILRMKECCYINDEKQLKKVE